MATRARWRKYAALGAAPVLAALVGLPTAASGASAASFTVKAVPAELETLSTGKSLASRYVESDPELLARTDATVISVGVKLDYDAAASYAGNLPGLAATSPRVTGQRLTGNTPAEVAYDAYAKRVENEFRADLAAKLAGVPVARSLRMVYGGVTVRIAANQARQLLGVRNVVAVHTDTVNKVETDASNSFIGSPTSWAQQGGQATAGKGIVFADLDTGLWPEHPSMADTGVLADPPGAPSGLPRACDYGDNPLTPQVDVFQCNHKVIGGQAFLDTYNAIVGGEVYGSARDSNGHGTHTTTTAAGIPVASAKVFGVERGPVSGVAPGAWVIEYKVCGLEGCFGSDTAAAVQQAIVDGADVINYSISGGSNPYGDLTELAFLDAYGAGVFVAASAGNAGPGAGTADHRSPWVTTVAASTQSRAFQSTLTVAGGGASATFVGSSITSGVTAATPIVLAKDIPGYNAICDGVPSAAAVSGKVVACQRGVIGRVQKGFNVKQSGAVGMILYNLPLQDTETDNHFLPTVHLADGTAFLAFMAAHPTSTASFMAGVKGTDQADVMAAFSSRGGSIGYQFLKPDITAPGVQILAGNTPTPDEVPGGPPGEYFQAIAGTSMSAPHIAGAAILLKSQHPSWSPGWIKSAMMTTAKQGVVKEDLTTPATPFDTGSGRIDLTKAGDASLAFADSVYSFADLGQDPLSAIQLNLPSINVPTMPGSVTVRRVAENTTNADVTFTATATAPAGSTIRVTPASGTIRRGGQREFTITITSGAPKGQYFGQVDIVTNRGPALHLPVAFFNQQGAVSLSSTCAPTLVKVGANTTCTITAQNQSRSPSDVRLETRTTSGLRVVSATNATVQSRSLVTPAPATLAGRKDAVPGFAPGSGPGGGFLDLALFGIAATPIGDDQVANFNSPPFVFAGNTYSQFGVSTNGVFIAGAASNADATPVPAPIPTASRPNGFVAPYWTDLDGAGSPGRRVGILTDGVDDWLVVQWDTHLFGLPAQTRSFQVWVGLNGTEDITVEYRGGTIAGAPAAYGLTVGAENSEGSAGTQLAGLPSGSYVVQSTPGAPGGSVTYTVTARGTAAGANAVTTSMWAELVPGNTVVSTGVGVTP